MCQLRVCEISLVLKKLVVSEIVDTGTLVLLCLSQLFKFVLGINLPLSLAPVALAFIIHVVLESLGIGLGHAG